MAITSIWDINDKLQASVKYVANKEKTESDELDALHNGLAYTTNSFKTENKQFVTGINCTLETCYNDMIATKKQFGKEGGILAFHAIQAFEPGEITAVKAHEIGIELANKLWSDRFEVILATHLDREHIHSHFIINSVSFKDGKRYYDNKKSYKKLRDTSDELCRAYGLSIIEDPTGKKVHYKEWKNESEGKTSYRTIYINGMEEALSRSRTRKELINNLKEIGFEVKTGKHLAIKLPYAKQYKRLYKLHGDKYSDDNINKRLLDNSIINWEPFQKAYYVPYPKKNLFGFQKDYFRIMYRLGLIEKKIKPQHIHPIIREDLVYIDDITEQATYIGKYNITTITDLENRITSLTSNLKQLESERNTIYNNIRICDDDYQKLELENKRDDLSSQIKELRNELKLCDKIKQRSQEIHYKLEEMDKQEQQEKGGVNNERRWRDSRSNG